MTFEAIKFEKGKWITRKINNPVKGTRLININTLEGETMSRKEEIEKLRTVGYVTRDDAAVLTGRQPGGNIPELFEKYDVRHIRLSGKQDCRMYLKSDLNKVPSPEVKHAKSIKRDDLDYVIEMLSSLENRIKTLEENYGGKRDD